jgi:small subunit ribosomal protein S13
MARIAGTNIPDNKKIEYSLPYVYGVGHSLAVKVLKDLNIDPDIRVKDLSDKQLKTISDHIEKEFIVEGNLKRQIKKNIRRLIHTNSYIGNRHAKRLPAHGQRTKTNSRTVRGHRKTTGVSRSRSSAPKK